MFTDPPCRAIARAVRSLEQPNINVSDAVDVRQELDLRIGRYLLFCSYNIFIEYHRKNPPVDMQDDRFHMNCEHNLTT